MIYFDNASTSKFKPEEVYDAANYYLHEVGVSPGRGSYKLGIDASRMLYKTRSKVGSYFGLSHIEKVLFTKNSTEALNLFFLGYLKKGDHVIISCYEHNAVLRPLQHLKDCGVIDFSVIRRDDLELPAEIIYKKYANSQTRLLVMTLASNLTGRIIFREDLYQCFKNRGITTLLDSSQGAGKIKLNMKRQGIDFLVFTGHKDLLALPGVGGLCCESSEHFEPLIQGGTGIHGESYTNPDIFPEGYEAGTLNMPAVWSLQASLDFIKNNEKMICNHEKKLTEYLVKGLKNLKNIMLYDADFARISTCCINVPGMTSDRLVALLDERGICVRGGIHCAILAHEAIGTVSTGTVRVSMNYKNTLQEVDELLDVLRKVGE